ncbi:MAG: hypothetical protein U9N12_07660 [Euryarchaeota archaeon]|nr:hypothetical protein [Euryarchaeota archaeon]
MRNFVAIGIVVLIITTAGCITPDEKPVEETGRNIGDRNVQRSDGGRQQGIGLQDDDGDGIPNKDDPEFQRGVNRSNNTVNMTRIDENNNRIDGRMENGVNSGITTTIT